jgi:hypothetical protein
VDLEDAFPPDEIRSPQEVARRALVLFATTGVAFGADRDEVGEWLTDSGLWAELSPIERGFLENPSPTERDVVNRGWDSECLIVLAWALGHCTQLPAADEQCELGQLGESFPPFADIGVEDFIATARLRSDDDLQRLQDDYMRLHAEGRNARLQGRAPRDPVNIEIIQERHRAINWVNGYDNAPWDEVTSDT